MTGLEAEAALGATTQATAAAAQSTRATVLTHGAIGAHHSIEYPQSGDGPQTRRAASCAALLVVACLFAVGYGDAQMAYAKMLAVEPVVLL